MEGNLLCIDIETSPLRGYTWGKYEQNVIEFDKYWAILAFSAKWIGGKHITKGLPSYSGYHKGSEDDKKLVKEIWNLLDKADVAIAHNGDQFDFRKINARFSYYGMPPPSPYKTVDTKKIAKRYFAFDSNKLDDLGEFLGLGRKVRHEGFEMWKGCMAGDPVSWNHMLKYNRQDVALLERIYLHLRPYASQHPNMGLFVNHTVCPKCQSKELEPRGWAFNKTTKYRRLRCKACGGWSRVGPNEQELKQPVSI